jgi:hypothetical protein
MPDKCRGCRAVIVWGRTAKGKYMPLDPEPLQIRLDPNGPVTVLDTQGEVQRGVLDEHGEVLGQAPHWSTCPRADSFRGR